MKTIPLEFNGYWLDANKSSVPARSGVYCVYASTYHRNTDSVSIRALIYVGESEDVRSRLANHERLDDWKKLLKAGETLCYSVAGIASSDRVRAEAAVIYKHKPPCNAEYVNQFPFDTTTMEISGTHRFLESAFTVFSKL